MIIRSVSLSLSRGEIQPSHNNKWARSLASPGGRKTIDERTFNLPQNIMNNTAATNKSNTRPAIFDFNRKGRGTYDGDTFIFHRGNQTDKGTNGKLEFISRKGGNHVIVKAFLDTDGNGRFSRDELIFRGSSSGEDIVDQLQESSGRIKWNLDDCTPCLRAPINRLTLNPEGGKRVEFFETSRFNVFDEQQLFPRFTENDPLDQSPELVAVPLSDL